MIIIKDRALPDKIRGRSPIWEEKLISEASIVIYGANIEPQPQPAAIEPLASCCFLTKKSICLQKFWQPRDHHHRCVAPPTIKY